MYQSVTIVGNLGADPDMKYMPKGDAVTQFRVATNRVSGSGEDKRQETTWFRVTVWGRQAEACHQYLTKGSGVLVVGRLVADPETGGPKVFEKRDGGWSASYEVRADTVQFLGKSPASSREYAEEAPTQKSLSDEVPF